MCGTLASRVCGAGRPVGRRRGAGRTALSRGRLHGLLATLVLQAGEWASVLPSSSRLQDLDAAAE